jgi:hypothetical protein
MARWAWQRLWGDWLRREVSEPGARRFESRKRSRGGVIGEFRRQRRRFDGKVGLGGASGVIGCVERTRSPELAGSSPAKDRGDGSSASAVGRAGRVLAAWAWQRLWGDSLCRKDPRFGGRRFETANIVDVGGHVVALPWLRAT